MAWCEQRVVIQTDKHEGNKGKVFAKSGHSQFTQTDALQSLRLHALCGHSHMRRALLSQVSEGCFVSK